MGMAPQRPLPTPTKRDLQSLMRRSGDGRGSEAEPEGMAPQRLRAFCFIRPVVGYGSVKECRGEHGRLWRNEHPYRPRP